MERGSKLGCCLLGVLYPPIEVFSPLWVRAGNKIDDGELLVRGFAVLKSQGRRKPAPWETRPLRGIRPERDFLFHSTWGGMEMGVFLAREVRFPRKRDLKKEEEGAFRLFWCFFRLFWCFCTLKKVFRALE